MNVILQKKATG